MTIEMLGTIPLGRNAAYGVLSYDATDWTDDVKQHIWDYGIRQIVNDAIASKTDDEGNALTDAEIVAKAAKRLATLESGQLRTPGNGIVDPVERTMITLAKAAIGQIARTKPEYKKVPKDVKGDDRVIATLVMRKSATDWADAITKYMNATPDLRTRAEAIVAARKPVTAAVEL